MKKIITLIAFVAFTMNATAQDIFDQLTNMKKMTETVITSDMFELIANIDIDSDDDEIQGFKDMVDSMQELRIYSTSSASTASQMKNVFQSYVGGQNLKKLMYVKEESEVFSLYYKPGATDKKVRDLVMFTEDTNDEGEDSAVLLVLRGDIDLDKVSDITRKLNIDGQSKIEKATKNN